MNLAKKTTLLIFLFTIILSNNSYSQDKIKRIIKGKPIEEFKKCIVFLGVPSGVISREDLLEIEEVDKHHYKQIYEALQESGFLSENGTILEPTRFINSKFTITLKGEFSKYNTSLTSLIKKKISQKFTATGALFTIQKYFHIITAKHAVKNVSNLYVFYNGKDGAIHSRSIKEIKKQLNVDWIYHENPKIDIAIIPFVINFKKDDVKTIPDDSLLTSDNLYELEDIFFLSYQPGSGKTNIVAPITRAGIISKIDEDSFLIDSFSFPGNSGSPVFLKPSVFAIKKSGEYGLSRSGPTLSFIGIIGGYLPYQEQAVSTKTLRSRIIFEENTGLSRVWPAEFINQIVESDSFQNQLKRIQQKKQEKGKE